MSEFMTDGQTLYEVVGRIQNHGLRGGTLLLVCDCRSETIREMGSLEQALCESVGYAA